MDGKVNSQSDLLGNLVKKDKIDFASEVVEKANEILSFHEKYFIDDNGNLWEHDLVGVVRNALETSGYTLDALWYSWGTKLPIKVGEIGQYTFNLIEYIENSGQSFSNVYNGISEIKDGLIVRGSDTMKHLVYNKDLNPTEIKITILKNLIDFELVEILKKENPKQYGDLHPDQFNRILEALGINKKFKDLYDADIMDIARKRFKWLDYDKGNVGYNIYKIQYSDGTAETGVIFAWSKSQDLPSEIEIKNRQVIDFAIDLPADAIGNLGLYDSERKLLIAILDRIGSKDVSSIDLVIASERGYCSFCSNNIQSFLRILSQELKIPEIRFSTRNEAGGPRTYKVTGARYHKLLFFEN